MRVPKAAVVLLSAAVLGAGAFAGALVLYPFEMNSALRKLALRRGGVARVRLGPLAAWQRDACAPDAPCRCIAFIHGMGDSALTWDKVLLGQDAQLPPAGTRLLAVELPGTGGSDPAPEPAGYAVAAQAKTVGDALAARCPRWTVVGNSLGGWIAAELALQRPEGVERLVLINSAGLDDPSGGLLETAKTLAEPTIEKLRDFNSRAYFMPHQAPPRAWRALVDSIKSCPTKEIFAALKREHLLDRRAQDIRVPTLILWGAADRVIPSEFGARLARLIPGSRLELIPDCGHLPQQECPAAVSRALF